MPEPVRVLDEVLPRFAKGFLHARQAIFEEPSDLPGWVRELLLAILSAQAGYADGGRKHLQAALTLGLTPAQLDEALGCLVLVSGLAGWERVGRPLSEAVDAREPTST